MLEREPITKSDIHSSLNTENDTMRDALQPAGITEEQTPQSLMPVSERLRQSERPASGEQPRPIEKVREAAKKVIEQHGEVVAQRHEAAQQGEHLNKDKAHFVQAAVTVVTVLLESIPGGLGPWGIGDAITAVEALIGHTLDGLKLSWAERGLYVVASAIPVVPGRLLVEGYRRWEESRRKDIHQAVRNPKSPQE